MTRRVGGSFGTSFATREMPCEFAESGLQLCMIAGVPSETVVEAFPVFMTTGRLDNRYQDRVIVVIATLFDCVLRTE